MKISWNGIIGIIGVLGAVLIAVGVAYPFAPQPKVTWSSPDVYAGITSTTAVQQVLTFKADQALQGVSVVVAVPEIARFVQIQPSTFSQVPAGQPQTVQLTFRAPSGAQFGLFDGTIHVRQGRRTLPQTLKASITYAVVPLPPDPGEAGKATIQGIDSDSDGVRDDVERWIALSYSTSAKTRAALGQWAKAAQTSLLQASDKGASVYNVYQRLKALSCLEYVSPSSDETDIRLDELRARMLNTNTRSKAWLQINRHFSGQGGSSATNPVEQKAQCSFNPDSMEN